MDVIGMAAEAIAVLVASLEEDKIVVVGAVVTVVMVEGAKVTAAVVMVTEDGE